MDSGILNIIKKHKGFIDIQTKKGVGSTISFYLPVLEEYGQAQSVTANVSEMPGAEYSQKARKISALIADESELVCQTVQSMLNSMDIEVIYITKIELNKTIELIKEHRIDILIIDIHSANEINTLLARISDLSLSIEIVITYGLIFDKSELVPSGLDIRFLAKPYSLHSLKNILKKYL